jgi:hypothetical protein
MSESFFFVLSYRKIAYQVKKTSERRISVSFEGKKKKFFGIEFKSWYLRYARKLSMYL